MIGLFFFFGADTRTDHAVDELIQYLHLRTLTIWVYLHAVLAVFLEIKESVGTMALCESESAVIKTDIICFLADVIHQNVHIIEVHVMVFDYIHTCFNTGFVVFDKFIRKALTVKGYTSVGRVIQYSDILGFVATFRVTCHGDIISAKIKLIIDALIPLHCIDLLQCIDLVCAKEIIYPFIAGSASESDNSLFLLFAHNNS